MSLANTYAYEMNLALAKSNIPMNYIRWGSVQMLPLTHAQIETEGSSNYDRHRNFLNAFGDNEEGRQKLKQSADHMIVMLNMVTGPYSCVIYYQNQEFAETYSTITVSLAMQKGLLNSDGVREKLSTPKQGENFVL